MKPDLSKLSSLKRKVQEAKDFSEPMNYFFDHFGDDPEFIGLGERVEEPFLEQVIRQVGSQLFGDKAAVAGLLLTRLPEHGFVHGGFTLGGHLGNIFYFEDILLGLMAVVTTGPRGETKLMRFTGRPMPDRWLRSPN